jgi:hypothetical protein
MMGYYLRREAVRPGTNPLFILLRYCSFSRQMVYSFGSDFEMKPHNTALRWELCFVAAILLLSCASCAHAGPPFKTDDPQTVDFLHWEFYVASMQQFQVHETDATYPHFEVNYGVAPNVQLHVLAPLGYVRTTEGAHYGYAETEVGVKYRFIQESEDVPQIGVFPLLELPTGSADVETVPGKMQAYIPVWVQKSWGKFTTYAGGGYWFNPGAGQENYTFSGWEAQYDFSEVFTFGGEAYYQTADTQGSEASSGINLGGYINLDDNNHILFSVGRTISGEPTVTGYAGYQLTI